MAAKPWVFSGCCKMSKHCLMMSCANPIGTSASDGYRVRMRDSNAERAAASIEVSEEYRIFRE